VVHTLHDDVVLPVVAEIVGVEKPGTGPSDRTERRCALKG
jgi:hypothetical protein